VTAQDLYMLGRRLTKLGEGAMRGSDAPDVPPGLRLIVADLAEHPDTPIGAIAARTGLPQSHVSQSVARLSARGAVETARDPRDGRRTLVRLSEAVPRRAARRGSASVDAALGEAAGVTDPAALAELIAGLEDLQARLSGLGARAPGQARPGAASYAWPLEAGT
jgi:DNA-binding MarR family transcriptional regulator